MGTSIHHYGTTNCARDSYCPLHALPAKFCGLPCQTSNGFTRTSYDSSGFGIKLTSAEMASTDY
jgi:hypothetical protein